MIFETRSELIFSVAEWMGHQIADPNFQYFHRHGHFLGDDYRVAVREAKGISKVRVNRFKKIVFPLLYDAYMDAARSHCPYTLNFQAMMASDIVVTAMRKAEISREILPSDCNLRLSKSGVIVSYHKYNHLFALMSGATVYNVRAVWEPPEDLSVDALKVEEGVWLDPSIETHAELHPNDRVKVFSYGLNTVDAFNKIKGYVKEFTDVQNFIEG